MTYFGPIWGHNWPENWAHRGFFSHRPESTHNLPVNQVPWSRIKTFEKMVKNLWNYHFTLIFNKRSIEEISSKKSKFYFQYVFENVVVHIQDKSLKDQMKSEGAYSIWIRVDARTERRATDGSASDKLQFSLQIRILANTLSWKWEICFIQGASHIFYP